MRPGDESAVKFLRMSAVAAAGDRDERRLSELWREVHQLAEEMYRMIPLDEGEGSSPCLWVLRWWR